MAQPLITLTLPVAGRSGTYVVSFHEGGVVHCTCPAWKYSGGPVTSRSCRHTDRVTDAVIGLLQPA